MKKKMNYWMKTGFKKHWGLFIVRKSSSLSFKEALGFLQINGLENSLFHINLIGNNHLPEIFLGASALALSLYFSLVAYNKGYSYRLIQGAAIQLAALLVFFTLCLLLNEGLLHLSRQSGLSSSSFVELVYKALLLITSLTTLLVIAHMTLLAKINHVEYFLLFTCVILGLMLIVSANDLLSLFLAIELQGLSLYVLASFKKDSAYSAGSGLKYFVLGSFATGLLLFGSALIYGLTGSIDFQAFSLLFHNNGLSVGPEAYSNYHLVGECTGRGGSSLPLVTPEGVTINGKTYPCGNPVREAVVFVSVTGGALAIGVSEPEAAYLGVAAVLVVEAIISWLYPIQQVAEVITLAAPEAVGPLDLREALEARDFDFFDRPRVEAPEEKVPPVPFCVHLYIAHSVGVVFWGVAHAVSANPIISVGVGLCAFLFFVHHGTENLSTNLSIGDDTSSPKTETPETSPKNGDPTPQVVDTGVPAPAGNLKPAPSTGVAGLKETPLVPPLTEKPLPADSATSALTAVNMTVSYSKFVQPEPEAMKNFKHVIYTGVGGFKEVPAPSIAEAVRLDTKSFVEADLKVAALNKIQNTLRQQIMRVPIDKSHTLSQEFQVQQELFRKTSAQAYNMMLESEALVNVPRDIKFKYSDAVVNGLLDERGVKFVFSQPDTWRCDYLSKMPLDRQERFLQAKDRVIEHIKAKKKK